MIQAENLSYTYSPGSVFEKCAVQNISFTVSDGAFCGIIGHTGSGKTTLIQMLAGLIQPTSGQVRINGLCMSDKKTRQTELRGKVGLVFQYPEYQLFEETVLADVMFGPKNMGLSDTEARDAATQALENVGIGQALFNKSPFDLSGGQKRRVAIAGVLALRPQILILDEPTAGLDPQGKAEILEQIHALHMQKKMTVLLVSHSMEDMARFADRILVMHRGHLAMDGTAGEVFSQGEALKTMGLDIPEITRVMLGLRDRGLPVNANIYTIESAVKEIIKVWGDQICSET